MNNPDLEIVDNKARHLTPSSKEAERQQLQKQIEKYLNKGNKIEKV